MFVIDAPRPVTLADREVIEALYLRFGHGDSAHAFPSLYLWQEDMGASLSLCEDVYTVRSRWRGKNAWFFPVGGDEAKAACLAKLLESGCDRLCYMTGEDVRFLEHILPGCFTVYPADGDSEYLYDRKEMCDMPGHRFVKIRNLCRKLERGHSVTAQPITEASLPLVRDIAQAWKPRSAGKESLGDEGFMARLLADWTALGLQGIILCLDGDPWAAAAGYPLGGAMFDCCLMKARENLAGIPEHLRAQLALAVGDGIERFNFEEDLGLEGLRQMKTRLRPCGKIQMYVGDRR